MYRIVKSFIFLITFITAFVAAANISLFAKEDVQEFPELKVFHSLSCHRCIEVKAKLMPEIEKKFKDRVKIEYYDIGEIENYKLLLGLKEKYGFSDKIVTPVFFLGGHFLNGDKIENDLGTFIEDSLAVPLDKKNSFPTVDLPQKFAGFKLFTVATAALIDGINPCAFTVIVFFISFLALQGYRKRELSLIGLLFIFSVFLTYSLIGLGLFGFLYRIRSFWFIIKAFNFIIGIFSMVLGVLSVYDFLKFKRTKTTEGFVLQLPRAVKNRIHSIIALHYRRKESASQITQRPHMLKLAISALSTGFVVSILEAICTGQVYLPTITFVLKTSSFKLRALGYLLLYNLLFILPLFVVFIFSLLGATSGEFSLIFKKHILTVKALMAVLFFGLGIFLIWRG